MKDRDEICNIKNVSNVLHIFDLVHLEDEHFLIVF